MEKFKNKYFIGISINKVIVAIIYQFAFTKAIRTG